MDSNIGEIYDVAIIGGGLAGMTLACLLGRAAGLKIACIDGQDPQKQIREDARTTAISYGSAKILEEAGIWAALEGKACPIEDIRILDGASPVLLNFLSTEAGGKSFGWIADNADIRRALLARMSALKNIEHIAPQNVKDFVVSPDGGYVNVVAEGQSIKARLVVGADGRNSATREWMGVRTRDWNYRQRAVICTVAHEYPHENAAVEHFWPSGPFAVLPMTDGENGVHRSSVVFTEHGSKRNSLMRLTPQEFEAELNVRFPKEYGTVRMINERMCFPLSLVHAASYIAPRMALVADAAHGIHPIAGQGLNLGFRDVKALADLVCAAARAGGDAGADALLAAYQRQRRFDNMTMVAVTDALVRLFSNNIPPVRFLRRAGLRAVSRLPPAKRFFMRQAMGDR